LDKRRRNHTTPPRAKLIAAGEWPDLGKLGAEAEGLQLAGLRPSGSAVATSLAGLHLSLLGDLQRVVDLDAKVSDGALSELI